MRLFTESKALRKSTKVTTISSCLAVAPSISLRKAPIISMVPQPGRKPAWFTPSLGSTMSLILLSKTLVYTFERVDIMEMRL